MLSTLSYLDVRGRDVSIRVFLQLCHASITTAKSDMSFQWKKLAAYVSKETSEIANDDYVYLGLYVSHTLFLPYQCQPHSLSFRYVIYSLQRVYYIPIGDLLRLSETNPNLFENSNADNNIKILKALLDGQPKDHYTAAERWLQPDDFMVEKEMHRRLAASQLQ